MFIEKNIISIFINYFEKELPKLEENYNWLIPNIVGFNKSGNTDYSSNIALKKYFYKEWTKSNFEEKIILSKIIVSDWGGVRTNKDITIQGYVKELYKNNPLTPIKGIASYSKIFSITNLDNYAIYDARVAASLNAIQWNNKLNNNGLAFHYVPGRNKIIGRTLKNKITKKWDVKEGFVNEESFKIQNLLKLGWQKINKNQIYMVYIKLLKECLKNFDNYKLYDLEMTLFANAEKECDKAVKSITI